MIEGLVARTDLTAGSDEQKIADAYRSYMTRPASRRSTPSRCSPTWPPSAPPTPMRRPPSTWADPGPHRRLHLRHRHHDRSEGADRYVVSTGHRGLGLPNRDYYLEQRWADKKVLYQAYVERMLDHDRLGQARRERRRHRRLRNPHRRGALDADQNRNRDETYNEYTHRQLASEAPGFPWQAYYTPLSASARFRA
jgi:putative endopeptidase